MRRLLPFVLSGAILFAQGGNGPMPIPLSTFKLSAGTAIVTLPDGTQAIDAGYGSSFQVDLGVTPAKLQFDPNHYSNDGVYQFTFSVENGIPPYPGGEYDIDVYFGSQKFCESYAWAIDALKTITMTCLSPRYLVFDRALPGGRPAQGYNNLILSGSVPGWQLYFKDFSWQFTPEVQ